MTEGIRKLTEICTWCSLGIIAVIAVATAGTMIWVLAL